MSADFYSQTQTLQIRNFTAVPLPTAPSTTSALQTLFYECVFLILPFSAIAVLSKVIRSLHPFPVQPLLIHFLPPAISFKVTSTA